jgi:hypothetical protein
LNINLLPFLALRRRGPAPAALHALSGAFHIRVNFGFLSKPYRKLSCTGS